MIVLDIQALQSEAYARRGVGRHVGDLVRALRAAHPDVVDVFAWNDRFDRGGAIEALDAELGLGDRLRPFAALRGADVDLLHVPAPFSPLARAAGEANDWVEMAVPVRARRLVVTLHDLIPWRFPDRYLADPSDHARYQSRLAMLLAADQVLAVSQSAADDAVELVGVDRRRLTVIGAGPSPGFRPSDEPLDTVMERLRQVIPGIEPGFVAVPAAIDWRKNLEGSLAAYARLAPEVRRDHQLVVVADLHHDEVDRITAAGAELGIGDELLVPGFVDDDVLLDLYRAADLVMVPSRYEGFGLPVVEARACGARVICSDVSSLPEVLPDERARFDPDDVPAMADMLARALTDDEFRAVLDSVPPAPYDWSSAARWRGRHLRAVHRSATPGSSLPATLGGRHGHASDAEWSRRPQRSIDRGHRRRRGRCRCRGLHPRRPAPPRPCPDRRGPSPGGAS